MEDKKKLILLAVLAIAAVVVAITVGVKASNSSSETITKFDAVPPKGIGKAERD